MLKGLIWLRVGVALALSAVIMLAALGDLPDQVGLRKVANPVVPSAPTAPVQEARRGLEGLGGVDAEDAKKKLLAAYARANPSPLRTDQAQGVSTPVSDKARPELEAPIADAIRTSALVLTGSAPVNLMEYQWLDVADMLRSFPEDLLQIDFVDRLTLRRTTLLKANQHLLLRNAGLLDDSSRAEWGQVCSYTGSSELFAGLAPRWMLCEDIREKLAEISIKATAGTMQMRDLEYLLRVHEYLADACKAISGQNARIDGLVAMLASKEHPSDPQVPWNSAPRPTAHDKGSFQTLTELLDAVNTSLEGYFASSDDNPSNRGEVTITGYGFEGSSCRIPWVLDELAWTLDMAIQQAGSSRFPAPSAEVWNPRNTLPRRRTIRDPEEAAEFRKMWDEAVANREAERDFMARREGRNRHGGVNAIVLADTSGGPGYQPSLAVAVALKPDRSALKVLVVSPAGIEELGTADELERGRGRVIAEGVGTANRTLAEWSVAAMDAAVPLVRQRYEKEYPGLTFFTDLSVTGGDSVITGVNYWESYEFTRQRDKRVTGAGVAMDRADGTRRNTHEWCRDAAELISARLNSVSGPPSPASPTTAP